MCIRNLYYSPENNYLLIFSFLLMLVAFPHVSVGSDTGLEPEGTIAIKVVNGSFENNPMPDIEVKLVTYRDTTQIDEKTVKTDDGGKYTFTRLKVTPGTSYLLSVRYRDVEYSSNLIIFDENNLKQNITLQVFEISSDSTNVTVNNHHIIMEANEKTINIQEVIGVYNGIPFVYMGREGKTLSFNIPEYAINIAAGDGLDIEENKISAIIPITPMGQRMFFKYTIPVEKLPYIFRRTLNYPTKKIDIFFKSTKSVISSRMLKTFDPIMARGEKYIHLGGVDFNPGESIEVLIDKIGLFKGSAIKFIVILVVVSVMIFALIYPFVIKQRGKNNLAMNRIDSSIKKDLELKNTLIEGIATLDEEYKSGRISENVYRNLREKKKSELTEVVRRLKNSTN